VAEGSANIYFEDFEGGLVDNTSITAEPFNFTAGGAYDAFVRVPGEQLVDPDGSALCGHCATSSVFMDFTKNIGQTIPSTGTTALSFKAYAQTAANGGASSHWSSIGLRDSTSSTFKQGINLHVNDLDNGTHYWTLDARHATDGGSNSWNFPNGRFFEETVTGTIYVDMDQSPRRTWATMTDSVGTVTSNTFVFWPNFNYGLNEVDIYFGIFGHGSYGTVDPADFDDITVTPEPGSLALAMLGALGLMGCIRRRR